MEDRVLLQRFIKENSQEAFAVLTARYLSLVYAVCRRELTDAEAAEDVTQAVFLILARKASSLGRGVILSGWLFQTARFAAKNARLLAQRRADYEQKAAEALMQQQNETEDASWAELEPLLNQSLAALKGTERDSVLLRFFQGASFAEIGATLGLSEEAARKRVTRALQKMRRFFTKNGVIVPSIALTGLLTAHAAKAAPVAISASIANLTSSLLAGHTTAVLTGSHAYQLTEGILKAMKVAQIKMAVGITAMAVIGLTAYSFSATSKGFAQPMSPPGHILVQTPGTTLNATQIAAHCLEAYNALQSYQGTTTVTEQSTGALLPIEMHMSATIQFAQPGKIHAEGRDSNLMPWAYTSDGIGTVEKNNLGGWEKVKNTELAIGTITGISLQAGTTIPAVLLNSIGTKRGYPLWGTPLALGKQVETEIREDSVEGQLCYVLTAHLTTPTLADTEYLWIDEKTFLLRRLVSDRQQQAQTITPNNTPFLLPASKTYIDERFTNERLNSLIPNSVFTLPVAQ
ncbi:MAG: sigma-70 family RNA polymerase sigma factor [Janthinobacterium lividum]